MPIPTRERLNIGYDDIRTINERIVYASISAFGEEDRKRGAPDSTRRRFGREPG